MRLPSERFEAARLWMTRNARPLDMARWRFHFEGGPREDALRALAAYQNADGGFGHALEADCWNPESSPIQTWRATELLLELGADKAMIDGILSYLSSGAGTKDGFWMDAIPSNDAHPRAPWWGYDSNATPGFNPSAPLAGFALRYADIRSTLYGFSMEIVKKARSLLMSGESTDRMHDIHCLMRLRDYCADAGNSALMGGEKAISILGEMMRALVEADADKWGRGYVCRPSRFVSSPRSPYYTYLADYCGREADFLIGSQLPSGEWPLAWKWADYPREWAISENWWKAEGIIENMRFLREFGALTI